ncbi:MAG: replication initiation factor domain-containing protein [Sulfurovum sp.]|nr:replication initiation factor domain-containing protein [Sulfurovum sp.]
MDSKILESKNGSIGSDKLIKPSHRFVFSGTSLPAISLDYIDTLYLSANIQDSLGVYDTRAYRDNYGRIDPKVIYGVALSRLLDSMGDYETLVPAMGYDWFRTENYRIGIMDYEKAIRANQPNCVIQYEHEHLFGKNRNLDGLDLPLGDDRSLYMIKRIDITKTMHTKTDYTKDHGFISRFKDDPLNPNRYQGSTVYLGSRKSGNVVRIYLKDLEIEASKDWRKLYRYCRVFGIIEGLTTFEHEMRRKYLKDVLGIDRLSELDRVWQASQETMGHIRIFRLTDKNKRIVRNGNSGRLKAMRLNTYEDFERPEKKKYGRSLPALQKAIRGMVRAYVESEIPEGDGASLDNFLSKLVADTIGDMVENRSTFVDDLGEWLE